MVAMKVRTSSGNATPSTSAFLSRMAILVSRSGGWMSAISPHSKRERKRSIKPRNFFRWCIARDHDLLLVVVQLVEGVKELFLRAVFVADQLDVVDQQHIRRAIAIVKLWHAVQPDAGDHIVHEPLARGVDDAHRSVIVDQRAPNRVHQVGLAHTDSAVDEQRVIAARGIGRHRARCGVRKLIACAHHKAIECEFRIERAHRRQLQTRRARAA